MNEELRECPFCGKDAVIRCDFCDEENYNIYFIECLGCDTMTSVHTEEKFAIKAWNIRYETKHETVEELREAYESWDEDSNWTPEEMEFGEKYKLESHYKYSRAIGFFAGFQKATVFKNAIVRWNTRHETVGEN